MGILNFNQDDTDPESPGNQRMMALAAALLQAGGPSLKPISFGQALGAGMQAGQGAYQNAKDRAMNEQMKQEELKMRKLQDLRAQTEFDNQQDWYKQIKDLQNPSQNQSLPSSIPQPMKMGMDSSGNMGFQSQQNIQPANQQPMASQGQTWLDRIPLSQLVAGGMMGIKGTKEAADAKKFMLAGIERKNNTTYIDPNTLQETYYADPTKGLNYDPRTKTVSALPGFNEANAAMKGSETAATEQAKANFNPMIINGVDASGKSVPTQTTVGDFIRNRQPAPQAIPQAGGQLQPQQAPTDQLTGPQGLDLSRLTPRQIQALQKLDPEAFATGATDFAQTKNSPAQTQPPQAMQPTAPQAATSFGIPLQSEAQKAEELAGVKLRTEPTLEQQTGIIKGKQGTLNASNENWIKQRYNPALEAGDKAKDVAASLDTLANVDFKTGWGSEAKIKGASILAGLGMAPKNAEFYAANGQVFQNEVMKQLVSTFEGQKGTQTEGDAKRVQQTFAQLANTPYANQYIADLARAKANRDARKAAFYQEAYPIAQQTGDLTEVDRRWMKLQGSIWNDPVLQKYKGAK